METAKFIKSIFYGVVVVRYHCRIRFHSINLILSFYIFCSLYLFLLLFIFFGFICSEGQIKQTREKSSVSQYETFHFNIFFHLFFFFAGNICDTFYFYLFFFSNKIVLLLSFTHLLYVRLNGFIYIFCVIL